MRKKIEYNLQLIEDLTAKGLSIPAVAKEMGMEPTTLQSASYNRPEVKEALEKGRERRTQANIKAGIKADKDSLNELRTGTESLRERIATIQDPKKKVFAAVVSGNNTRPEIFNVTGLGYREINNALNELCDEGLIVLRDMGQFDGYYTPENLKELLDKKVKHVDPSTIEKKVEETPKREIKSNSLPEASTQPAEIDSGVVVSDARLSHAVELTKPEEKNVTPHAQKKKTAFTKPPELASVMWGRAYMNHHNISDNSLNDATENVVDYKDDFNEKAKEFEGNVEVTNEIEETALTVIDLPPLDDVSVTPSPLQSAPSFLERVLAAREYLEKKYREDMDALNRTMEILKEMETINGGGGQ